MMERGEPALVPEWYKGSTGGASASGNSNHRNRSSDFCRSVSSNGFLNRAPYSSFGKSHHDKDREKDHDLRERNRSCFVENGFSNYTDSFVGSRSESHILRRTTSSVIRQGEPLFRRPSSDLSNGVLTGASTIRIIDKHSFEREFPSLGVEDRQPDIARVSSPGLTTALDNLSRISSITIGGDGWRSALAEVPVRVGGNGPTTSSATSIAALSSSTGLNMAETLAQAPLHAHTASQETVDTQKIEELTRLQYSKLIPMRPSMPKSLALNSLEKYKVKGTRSGEYSVPSKVGLQSSSQLASQTLRAPPSRSDVVKTFQAGNLQVFNREKNGITPIAQDGLNMQNASKIVVPHVGVPTVVTPQLKSPVNQKQKLDKGCVSSSTQTSSGEKRPNSQAQNRNDFFNILRQKAPPNRSPDPPELRSASQETGKESPASCFGLEHSMESDNGATGDINVASEGPNGSIINSEGVTSTSDPVIAISLPDNGEENLSSNPDVQCVSDNADETLSSGSAVRTISLTVSVDVGSSPDPVIAESVPENVDDISSDPHAAPSEEEAAFLRSLGWDENAEEDALRPEEIADFYQKHPELKASSRLGHRKSH